MVEMKQLMQVHAYHALMVHSAILLALLLLMDSVRLDTIVQLGSQLAHHLHMSVHSDISVLQGLVVQQSVNLASTKMSVSKRVARNALSDTIAMQHMVE